MVLFLLISINWPLRFWCWCGWGVRQAGWLARPQPGLCSSRGQVCPVWMRSQLVINTPDQSACLWSPSLPAIGCFPALFFHTPLQPPCQWLCLLWSCFSFIHLCYWILPSSTNFCFVVSSRAIQSMILPTRIQVDHLLTKTICMYIHMSMYT